MNLDLIVMSVNYHLFDEEGTGEMVAESTGADNQEGSETTSEYTQETYAAMKENHKQFFDTEVQGIIKKRLGDHKKLETDYNDIKSKYEERSGIFELLSERFGVDDPKLLAKAIEDDIIQKNAVEKNIDPDKFRQERTKDKEYKELQKQLKAFQEKDQRYQQQVAAQKKIQAWEQEAEQLKEAYPDFNLKDWSKNDEFKSLLKSGVSMKKAYEAADLDNIKKRVSQQTEKNTADSIRAGKRVKENATGQTSTSSIKKSPSEMTSAEIKDIERRVLNGESISF